jgi:hypothetical protein
MKITAVFALTFLAGLPLVFAQENDVANAVLQTERDLATVYLNGDADGIAQGVMEDYTSCLKVASERKYGAII